MQAIPPELLSAFGFGEDCHIQPFGPGLIHHTWKVEHAGQSYILQRLNDRIFPKPEKIIANMTALGDYLARVAPEYPFISPLPATDGRRWVHIDGGGNYRLTRFITGSHTVTVAKEPAIAYEAARQFGRFTRLLSGFDPGQLEETLPGFHDLTLRQQQFDYALIHGDASRRSGAQDTIRRIGGFSWIPERYRQIRNDQSISLRVTHHDTKISNVLFDARHKGICVIDLDTVMPGLFISDLGDLLRTGLAPASEEETDLTTIVIRPEYFEAIVSGWLEEMGDELRPEERDQMVYAGQYMCYMQAIRFLTDHLRLDRYYGAQYPGHNLARANNQLRLLEQLTEQKSKLLI